MAEKVAIFLDVENLSGWLKADGGATLLKRASELGRVVVRRAYGDFSNPAVSVRQPALNLLGFEFVQVYHPVKGKNSADIQIVVDVMEYLARIPDLEWIVLATGDSDFSPLFRRLRELDKSVVGVGPRSVLSEAVKKSCNQFIYTDEGFSSDSAPVSSKTSSLKTPLLYGDALGLLERVLCKFPDGISLSTLKTEMLKINSAFDQQNLGFSSFTKFLQSASKIATLYQVKQVWYAKAPQKSDADIDLISHNRKQESTSAEPTIDLYKNFLHKSGWRSFESCFLWDCLTKLTMRFPEGFAKNEAFQYLIEAFGRNWTNEDLRSTIYMLCEAGYITQKQQNNEAIWITELPESERIISKRMDIVMVQRLGRACKHQNIPFIPELVIPLLINSYVKEQFKALIENARQS